MPASGCAPVLEGRLDLLAEDRPDPTVEVVGDLGVQVDRVEQRAPDVVLHLRVRGVADAHGARPGIPRQVVERGLGEVALAADAVHDLQVVVALRHVGDEREEVDCLPVEPERVHPPQRERRVADPRVAVVVVPCSTNAFRQRGRGRGRDRPGRRIRQSLEGQGTSLEVAAPRVVREAAAGEPVLPVVRRPLESVVRLLPGRGWRHRAPRQGDEALVPFPEQRSRSGLPTLEPEAQVGGERERHVGELTLRVSLVVAELAVRPRHRRAPVVQHRLALHHRLHLARHAPDRPQQRVLGVVVHRGAVVLRRHPFVVVPRPDEHHVAHDDPAGRRRPARLEHHGARQVAPRRRHADVRRPEPEATRVPPEQRPEDARRVQSRHAHPVDVPARRDECRHLAVGEEAVVRDRHGRRLNGARRLVRGLDRCVHDLRVRAAPGARKRRGRGCRARRLSQDCCKIPARSVESRHFAMRRGLHWMESSTGDEDLAVGPLRYVNRPGARARIARRAPSSSLPPVRNDTAPPSGAVS